jgi:hypothetical protein
MKQQTKHKIQNFLRHKIDWSSVAIGVALLTLYTFSKNTMFLSAGIAVILIVATEPPLNTILKKLEERLKTRRENNPPHK